MITNSLFSFPKELSVKQKFYLITASFHVTKQNRIVSGLSGNVCKKITQHQKDKLSFTKGSSGVDQDSSCATNIPF